MAFKPDYGLVEEMRSWKNKAILVASLEMKQKKIVFRNSSALSNVTWNSGDLEMTVIIYQQIIGSPNTL